MHNSYHIIKHIGKLYANSITHSVLDPFKIKPRSTPPNTDNIVSIVSKLCEKHDPPLFSMLCLLVVLIVLRPWSELEGLRGDLQKNIKKMYNQ